MTIGMNVLATSVGPGDVIVGDLGEPLRIRTTWSSDLYDLVVITAIDAHAHQHTLRLGKETHVKVMVEDEG